MRDPHGSIETMARHAMVIRSHSQGLRMAHDAGGDNRYTRGLAELIGALRYERIPTEVIDELCDIMPTLDRRDDAGRVATPLAR